MGLTKEETLQFLGLIQMPEEAETRCRELMEKEDYPELYRYLRSIRGKFLEELHMSERRLDQLDHLIYDTKKKNESGGLYDKS